MYNEKHKARLSKETRLPNSEGKVWETIFLGNTEINVSGKVCNAKIYRTKNGNISVTIDEVGIWGNDGWLSEGTCTEGYGDEVIISQFNHS